MNRAKQMLVWTAVVVVVAVGVVVAATAQSTGSTEPQELMDNVPLEGTLTGSRAGAFRYYTIEYPGDLRVVNIEMWFAPADPVTRLGVGFNVYGPNGYFIGEGGEAEGAADGLLRLWYSDASKATWLVQVYNYIPDHTIGYTIVAEGLPRALVPSVTVTHQVISDGMVTVAEAVSSGPGWIVIHADEDGKPGPVLGHSWVASGVNADVRVKLDASKVTSELYAMLHADEGDVGIYEFPGADGPVLVAGYPVMLSFRVLEGGLTAVGEPDIGLGEAKSGLLPGNVGGSFAKYSFSSPGDSSRITVRLAFVPDTPAMAGGVGFDVYGPSGRVASGVSTGVPTERQATFTAGEWGDYLIQVYNYVHGTTLDYTLTIGR